jgi:hypothetical protein
MTSCFKKSFSAYIQCLWGSCALSLYSILYFAKGPSTLSSFAEVYDLCLSVAADDGRNLPPIVDGRHPLSWVLVRGGTPVLSPAKGLADFRFLSIETFRPTGSE